MDDNNYDKVMEIIEGIASFNGKLDDFRESIKQDEYQEIISLFKGDQLIINSSVSENHTKTINNGEDGKKDESEREFNNDISENKIPDLATSLVSQNKEINNDNKFAKPPLKINVWSLFKYPSIRYKFIFLNILWIGTRASFNGISILAKSFPDNFYVNIIIGFVLESIAYCVT